MLVAEMATSHVGAMSYAQYLVFEQAADRKHEYVNGHVHAMAGGSTEHARLAARLIIQFGQALAGRPCEVFSSDLHRVALDVRAGVAG
jgi:hypothetical protein